MDDDFIWISNIYTMIRNAKRASKLIKIKTKISRKSNLLIEGNGYETVNIKGVNKDVKIYAVRSTPRYLFSTLIH